MVSFAGDCDLLDRKSFPNNIFCFQTVLIKLLSRGSSSGKNILLVGLSESGKTTLFSRLVSREIVNTVTSMKQNEGIVKIGNKSFYVVDLPGYDRLRKRFFDDFKQTARSIVIVIDSLACLSNLRDVADLVYTTISDSVVSSRKLPILVVCNKQDETKAKSAQVLRKQLEKEINALRETRAASLASTEEKDDSRSTLLGKPNKTFEWTDIKNSIDFVDCSCIAEDDNSLEPVGSWIRSH